MVAAMIPAGILRLPEAKAAATSSHQYMLDTDGIDAGAQYLIVSGTVSSSQALRMDGTTPWQGATQPVTVQYGTTISAFEGEDSCLWTFSAADSGTVTNNGYYLHIVDYVHFQTVAATLQFAHFGNGAYGIYSHGGANDNLRYLYFNSDGNWATEYNYGWVGTDASAYKGFVYLYKLVALEDATYSVQYDSNGSTAGTVPAGVSGLNSGDVHIVGAPSEDLVKVTDTETLRFKCWNTAADGSGTDYAPGDQLTVGVYDVTLYAKWYAETKYTVTVVTNLDGVPTDVQTMHAEAQGIHVSADGHTYIPLTRVEAGTYTGTVSENGTYQVYLLKSDGTYQSAHGHQVVIFNQNGETTLYNYRVSYDTGTTAQGDTASWWESRHAYSKILVTETVPVRAGYSFVAWEDEAGNRYTAGDVVTESLGAPVKLTAIWEKSANIKVNITIHHAADGGYDHDDNMDEVTFELLHIQNDLNVPVGTPISLTAQSCEGFTYAYDQEAKISTYTATGYTFTDLEPGSYTVSTAKHHYTAVVSQTQDANGDTVIHIEYTYDPSSFDLDFEVEIADFENTPKSLLPQAVNIKISCWAEKDGVLGWHVITQQEGDKTPVTVLIDQNTGKGSGFFPVWKYLADESGEPYYYRVTVSSYVMPDGTIVAAEASQDRIYSAGIYEGTVTIEALDDGDDNTNDSGAVPDAGTELVGAYFDDSANEQSGVPLVTVKVTPYTVTFRGNGGHISEQEQLILSDQFAYPNLERYVPEDHDGGKTFAGWYLDEALTQPAENLSGKPLSGDVAYYAKWSDGVRITGTITIDGTYQQDGVTVEIPRDDRAKKVMVVLKKYTSGSYNDVASQLVYLPENYGDSCAVTYEFDIADDGGQYFVAILELNYSGIYDNNGDGQFTAGEAVAIWGDSQIAQVDVQLSFVPETYFQTVRVDASQLDQNYRPSSALVEIHDRDLGTDDQFGLISQHTVAPYGIPMDLDSAGMALNGYRVWRWHTNGTEYEYQMKVSKLYGNVAGVFTPDGDGTSRPYDIHYGVSAWWDNETGGQSNALKATLIPNTYKITFNLGLEEGEDVKGMEEFLTDPGEDADYHYSYAHTWSFGDHLVAFPYRAGYVFEGWTSDHEGVVVNNHGYVTVAAGLSQDVMLTAKWKKIEDDTIAYVVRYLKTGTTQVLHGAKVVECSEGDKVYAYDEVIQIPGYLFDKADRSEITVKKEIGSNIITLYYKTDDGSTEQVDSNLHMDKTATLEDNGTYTIWMETFTTENPVTTLIQQDTPLDIVLVLDQSGSIAQSGYLDDLQSSVDNFIDLIASHGRTHEVDHRIALVGYAGDADELPTSSTDFNTYPLAGGNATEWVNTGVFDSNGDFHPYPVTGFNYTAYAGNPEKDGTYYVYNEGEYLLLMHHDSYYHLVTEDEAKTVLLDGGKVYGYAEGGFVELTRNLSGLWLYGDTKLYSDLDFFTYHEDVWTHRKGLDARQIHAYGTGENYHCTDGHSGLYTRKETREAGPQLDVYKDALIPVTVGAHGAGGVNPSLIKSANGLGSNGGTFVQYGIKMANKIFAANPLDPAEGRVRIMVMFTDGLPGIGTFDESEANAAIAAAYESKNTHNAYSYAIGHYTSASVTATSDVAVYMNAVSSNYPDAKSMSDVYTEGSYYTVSQGSYLNDGRAYFARISSGWWWNQTYTYYPMYYGTFTNSSDGRTYTGWFYENNNTRTLVSTNYNAVVGQNSTIGSYTICANTGGYKATEHSGYYSTTNSEQELKDYFSHIVQQITTKITKEIILHEDTILRDIMGQGLVLTEDSVITVYTQDGVYNAETQSIDWAVNADGSPVLSAPIATLAMNSGSTESAEKADVSYTDLSGQQVTKTVSRISVYNWGTENPVNPAKENYHPHTVDITGYAFNDWFISDLHPEGKKMLVQITRVEARDEVEWGRSTQTNYDTSGLWLPTDERGNRELLLPFDQPTTIFVERAYVLDYAKCFDLSGWYYDAKDESDLVTGAVHVDMTLSDGMNWFDPADPAKAGKTAYGSITVDEDGKVSYTPINMNWGKYDQFYVFGDTWRRTVLAQDANENGNLWSKVSVIPASSVYYEDSFVTDAENSVEGFTFTGNWTVVGTPDENTEAPEHLEDPPYGDVHGWIDSMVDDTGFSDGTAHGTGLDGNGGAQASFCFTGTGVDIYTRTNIRSGMVVAMLYSLQEGKTPVFKKSIMMDNLASSGDYYQIPTVSFMGLAYGTYQVKLLATRLQVPDDLLDPETGLPVKDPETQTPAYRSEYYLDGIRVYNPLGSDQSTDTSPTKADTVVKDAYGKELNSVFTEVRDILLDNNSFTAGQDYGQGLVFIDWIRECQKDEYGTPGTGMDTAALGTYEDIGPKNEVYLRPGQAVVIKVDPRNTYYVGMKKLSADPDKPLSASVSGITNADVPVTVPVNHTTDLSYQVCPDADGYIVIANEGTSQDILSLTKLRTANNLGYAGNGVELVQAQEAVAVMARFSMRLVARDEAPAPEEPPIDNSENDILARELFGDVRRWLEQ